MVEKGSVHVDVGNETPPADYDVDLDYRIGDLDLRVAPLAEGLPTFEVRRADDTLFLTDGEDPWQAVDRDDPRLTDGVGLIPHFLALDLMADLRATLVGGGGVRAAGSAEINGLGV